MFSDRDRIHKGSGEAIIYRAEDGSHLLRLENLNVTNGPDLHVFLSPHTDPKDRDDVMSPGYFSLGPLKGNQGNQNYPIPIGPGRGLGGECHHLLQTLPRDIHYRAPYGGVGRHQHAGGSGSLFEKSDLSVNWTFWIPAFAGMTDLGAIFHVPRRGVVENSLNMLSIYHG